MSKQTQPVLPPEFDSPEYDSADVERSDLIQELLDLMLTRTNVEINKANARRKAAEDAVEACLGSCLTAIDMLYVRRDDHAVTRISLQNNSWEAEPVPVPCSVDNWLRAAIPESAVQPAPYMLREFLRVQSRAPTRSSNPNSRPQSASRTDPSKPRGLAQAKSTLSQAKNSHVRATHLTPEQQAAEDRLREELEIRRAQEEVMKEVDEKDATERAKLSSLQKELQGREYSYDHKGSVVPLTSFNPEGQGSLLAVADFRVQSPGSRGLNSRSSRAGSPGATKRPSPPSTAQSPRPTQESVQAVQSSRGSSPGPTNARTTPPTAPPQRSTPQQNFVEVAGRTQPSAMQTLKPSVGITLRQGAQSKVGPRRNKNAGMTREEFEAMKEQKMSLNRPQQATPIVPGSSKPHKASSTDRGMRGSAAGGRPNSEGVDERRGSSAGTSAPPPPAPDVPSWMIGGKPKQGSPPKQRPATPDVNLLLVSARDWGTGGSSGGFSGAPSLPAVKPTDRTRELEVGRTSRLPRDRASMATMAPPLSPVKAASLSTKVNLVQTRVK